MRLEGVLVAGKSPTDTLKTLYNSYLFYDVILLSGLESQYDYISSREVPDYEHEAYFEIRKFIEEENSSEEAKSYPSGRKIWTKSGDSAPEFVFHPARDKSHSRLLDEILKVDPERERLGASDSEKFEIVKFITERMLQYMHKKDDNEVLIIGSNHTNSEILENYSRQNNLEMCPWEKNISLIVEKFPSVGDRDDLERIKMIRGDKISFERMRDNLVYFSQDKGKMLNTENFMERVSRGVMEMHEILEKEKFSRRTSKFRTIFSVLLELSPAYVKATATLVDRLRREGVQCEFGGVDLRYPLEGFASDDARQLALIAHAEDTIIRRF